MPPLPTNAGDFPADAPFSFWGYNASFEPGGCDMRQWEQSPVVGDVTSSLTHYGTGGLRYINADYTVTASRLPDGEYLGLAAQSHHGTAGVATGAATLCDRHGPLGTSAALALAQPADAFQPPSL